MLTHKDIALIRRQICQAELMRDTFGGEFLARIFWANPEVRACFPKDVFNDHRRIFDFICFAVDNLDRADQMALASKALLSYRGYVMPTPKIEAIIGAALLGTLQNRLQGEFCEESRSAWARAYLVIADRIFCHSTPVRVAA